MSYDESDSEYINQLDKATSAKHAEPLSTPKLQPQIRRTKHSKKIKPAPIFTVGELIPWKGVWFQLVQIVDDTQEKFLILAPKIDG